MVNYLDGSPRPGFQPSVRYKLVSGTPGSTCPNRAMCIVQPPALPTCFQALMPLTNTRPPLQTADLRPAIIHSGAPCGPVPPSRRLGSTHRACCAASRQRQQSPHCEKRNPAPALMKHRIARVPAKTTIVPDNRGTSRPVALSRVEKACSQWESHDQCVDSTP